MKKVGNLFLPEQFNDEKNQLKQVIDDFVEKAVRANDKISYPYFIVFSAKFKGDEFQIKPPIIVNKLPPFTSNQMVFWVNNKTGVCELLWMVCAAKKGQKLKVEFNKSGVAYLQAKGAMPS